VNHTGDVLGDAKPRAVVSVCEAVRPQERFERQIGHVALSRPPLVAEAALAHEAVNLFAADAKPNEAVAE